MWLTKSGRAEEVGGLKECRVESLPVDQMDLLKDQGLRALPKMEVVGVDGDPVLVAQVLPGSVSQMDGDTGVYSGQLCWGSELLGTVMPLKTPERLSGLLGPKAEKALTGPKPGLLVVSIGLQSPELSDPSLSTDVM